MSAAACCVPELPPSVPTWVVDPVDGTQLVHGVRRPSMSAVRRRRAGTCGENHAARRRAVRRRALRGGAWLNGKPTHDGATTDRRRLSPPTLATSGAPRASPRRAHSAITFFFKRRPSPFIGSTAAAPPSTAACTSATAQSRGTGARPRNLSRRRRHLSSPRWAADRAGRRRGRGHVRAGSAVCAGNREGKARAPSARPSSAGSPTARGWWCRRRRGDEADFVPRLAD